MDQFAELILKGEDQNLIENLNVSSYVVTDGDKILFNFYIFRNISTDRAKIGLIDVNDRFQDEYKITYGQIIKDLGRCAFIQIIKENAIRAGRSDKVVAKIA